MSQFSSGGQSIGVSASASVLPLEMRRERREFFPEHAGKGSLLSSKEAETGLLWMWAGLSCFLSSGDGYVGELLELQQVWEEPFGSCRG